MTSTSRNAGRDLFPLTIATGPAFCNRESERRELKSLLVDGEHAWLIGPRRFGKTSLVMQVCRELERKRKPRIEVEAVDLFVAHNLTTLDELLRQAVGRLSARFIPKNRRALGKLGEIFASFRPELALGNEGVRLKLFSQHVSPETLHDMLRALDAAALAHGRRAVIVLDEFQQIVHIDTKHAIEGAIRAAAQHARATSFVFLGSDRTLLAGMFENADRPLYRLCHKIVVDRIGRTAYERFLLEAATLRWKRALSAPALDAVFTITECHPYYVNLLCRALFEERRPPSAETVHTTWARLAERERRHAQLALDTLSPAQRAVLYALANDPTDAPTSQAFLGRAEIAASTMVQALDVLKAKDFIVRREDGVYELVDPMVRTILT